MTNYPPGVTGNEFAIAGPTAERAEHVSCDQDATYVTTHLVETYVGIASDLLGQALLPGQRPEVRDTRITSAMNALLGLKEQMNAQDEALFACDFEGDVDVWYAPSSVRHWICPRCGHEYEEDLTDD